MDLPNSDLVESRKCNETQVEKIQLMISENEQKLTNVKKVFEQQLRECEENRDATIKTLREDFEKKEQEKDHIIQTGLETTTALQQEIDKLRLLNDKVNGELDEVRCKLTETINILEGEISQLKSNITLLKTEKEDFNASLQKAKSDLAESRQCNETQAEKIQLMISENEQKLTDITKVFEQQLTACEENRDATIKTLREDFEKKEQEKDHIIQNGLEISTVLRQDIDKLSLINVEVTGELHEVKCKLSGAIHTLEGDISQLKSVGCLLEAEKEQINTSLKMTQNELAEAKLYSETLKQLMRQREEKRDGFIKSLQVELLEIKENIITISNKFTEELQEKDSSIQTALEKQNSLQQEVECLSSENDKVSEEMQTVQFVLEETINTLDDTTAEKLAVLKCVEEAQAKLNAEIITRSSLENQLAEVETKLQEEILSIKHEKQLLFNFLVKITDHVNEFKASIDCVFQRKIQDMDTGSVDVIGVNNLNNSLQITKENIPMVSTDGCNLQTIPVLSLSAACLDMKACFLPETEVHFKKLLSILESIEHSTVMAIEARIDAEVKLSSTAQTSIVLERELGCKLEASKIHVSQLEECIAEIRNRECTWQAEINDLKVSNEVLAKQLCEKEKQIRFLNDRVCTAAAGRDMFNFQTCALQQRNEQLKKTAECSLAFYYSYDVQNWESLNFKKRANLLCHNIMLSRKLVEEKLFDVCNSIKQEKAMYNDPSSDGVKTPTFFEVEIGTVLNDVEEQTVQLHIKLLNTFLDYVKWLECDSRLHSTGTTVDGELSQVLHNLSEVKSMSDAQVKDLQSQIEIIQGKVNSLGKPIGLQRSDSSNDVLCKQVSPVCPEEHDCGNFEDSLEVKSPITRTTTQLSNELSLRLEKIHNHSREICLSPTELIDKKHIDSTFFQIVMCSLSAIDFWLTNLQLANKRLCTEKNAALKLVSSLQLECTEKNKLEASLQKAYMKVVDESENVRTELVTIRSQLGVQEKENQRLQGELKARYSETDLQTKCDLLGNAYEEKLQRMKQKMTALFKEEMTKIEPVKKNNEHLELLCKKYTNKITKYEEYTKEINTKMKRLKDELQSEIMDKKFLQQQVATLRLRKEARSFLETPALTQEGHSEQVARVWNEESNTFTQRRSQCTVNLVIETEDVSTITFTRRKSLVQKSSAQDLRQAFTEEDEDGEEFNNTYLADMKAGRVRLPEPDKFGKSPRLTELQYRNSLCLPHLKSSYPVETQFNDPREFRDDDLKLGFGADGGDSSSLSLLLPGERHRKKDRGQTSYQKPGPPTPVKNGGRRSLQASDTLSPRLALREHNETVGNRAKRTTPSRIRALFSSKSTKRESENTPITPRGED